MSFGENVGYYRKLLNITQEELAQQLFVSRQTVSRWETDSTFPDVETIIKLCDIFGCDMDTLVRKNAQENTTPTENTEKKATDSIEEMKEEIKRKRLVSERIIGAIAAPVVLLTTLAYLLCGFLGNLWHPMWLLFVCAGFAIGVSAVIVDAVLGISSDEKKLRQEKRKIKKQNNQEKQTQGL
ncbi:MAG: helix-turn-helix domain-containing protein [Clostridia bacterium]|nr:helix-turn-helix domain-containing protein [Clostridia bacterium]